MLDSFLALSSYLLDTPSLRKLSDITNWDDLLVVEISSKYLRKSEEDDECNCGKFLYGFIKKLLKIQGVEHPDVEEYPIKGMFAVACNPSKFKEGESINTKLYIPNPKKLLAKDVNPQEESKLDRNHEVVHEDVLKTELEWYKIALHEVINQSEGLPPFEIVDTHICNL
jgi:hypothetical protein